MSGSVLFPLLRQQSKCFFFCAICIFPKMFYSFYGILRYNITGCFPENIRSTLWFSYDHTSGQILFKSAAILPYKITKFRLFFEAVLNPPYWNVNKRARKGQHPPPAVLNPPYWNVNIQRKLLHDAQENVLNPPYWNVNHAGVTQSIHTM